jgi:NAD(P)-dependent dehydrogenase (short-subunit alcohol dehydrogenase family)
MSEISSGTVLITGSTGGLGRSATMAMANRPEGERPGLLLVGRPGRALHDVGDEARAAGATVHASVTLDQRWAHLRDGDFVVVDKVRDVMPIAKDPDRERRLWDATSELLNQALSGR